MNQLTNEQRATLFELLDAQERVLESAMHEHVARLRDCSAPGMTPTTGDIELIREHPSRAVVRDVRDLRVIEAARARLAAGSAVVCIDCGSAIAFERLLAQPTATRCPHCQVFCEQAVTGRSESMRRPLNFGPWTK
ncbi:TraR/DksA family transcriptional regulator [Dechloromonas sp. A34]|uniref:TraR/DksA family transcriptional regulator n=1 Tax=Dechloromonas sp. A34 TaxID=447588 RepID=UPI0022496C12|nr:TraR/DksA family transcriptional regulator [Dechloromonas sp. A34]